MSDDRPELADLLSPIGVFDAGVGSYAVVQRLRRQFPLQDIIYLADRASFPYGAKSPGELLACVEAAVGCLASLGCRAVVLASNAPSVMVLEKLQQRVPLPVVGITPPISSALSISHSKRVAVLAVASLVASSEMARHVSRQAEGCSVELVNASPLVELVEDGTFLSNPVRTEYEVRDFMCVCRENYPELDVCSLSSTHLPWLRSYFEVAAPEIIFLDPADEAVRAIEPFLSLGSGATVCLATESDSHPLEGLVEILRRLGVNERLRRLPNLSM